MVGPLKPPTLATRIFRALCEHPYGLTMSELITQVYPDPAREPTDPEGTVQVTLCKANAKWRAAGELFQIRGQGGPGSKYRIFIQRKEQSSDVA
jgi:hypothetical protein